MPICKHCGVELQPGVTVCPLCGLAPDADTPRAEPLAQPDEQPLRTHSWMWELFTFLCLAGAIVVFAVDFAYGTRVSWSRYPLTSLGLVWLTGTLIRFRRRRPYMLIVGETLGVVAFLWFLSANTQSNGWFKPLALPIAMAVAVFCLVAVAAARLLRGGAQVILAVSMVAAGLFMMSLELILHHYVHDRLYVSWSLVAFACILPLVGFLLYTHRRMKQKGFSFRKMFHA